MPSDKAAAASRGARIKVCGITEQPEIDVLGANHVDFVGLWYAVPGGPHDLPLSASRALADAALATTDCRPCSSPSPRTRRYWGKFLDGTHCAGSNSTGARRPEWYGR
jgi:hypothetical protein